MARAQFGPEVAECDIFFAVAANDRGGSAGRTPARWLRTRSNASSPPFSQPTFGAVGRIILVTPDGTSRIVAEGLRFPNGIAVSTDNRRLVVAEIDGEGLADYDIETDGGLRFRKKLGFMKDPDGIYLDRDGAVWVSAFNEDAFVGIDRDGKELQRIRVPGRRAVACAFGGPDRTTLFCLSAVTSPEKMRQRRSSARIDVVDVETPGSGYP